MGADVLERRHRLWWSEPFERLVRRVRLVRLVRLEWLERRQIDAWRQFGARASATQARPGKYAPGGSRRLLGARMAGAGLPELAHDADLRLAAFARAGGIAARLARPARFPGRQRREEQQAGHQKNPA